MCKCIGCGVQLQNNNKNLIGYTKDITNDLCERCFRIRNYNDYKVVLKDNNDFINILKNINNTNDLVVLVVDLFNISENIEDIRKYINNKILLVLTKRDLLPKSCYDEKLKGYFNNYNLNVEDTVIISSLKNYNFDLLYDKINKYKTSNNIYVVGFTNSGKSTMINKLIYNYSDSNIKITTSNLPSTTIDSIKVKLNNDLTIIDTPGLLDDGDIINYVDSKSIKKIIPTTEIKPITYQIKSKQSILVEDLVKLEINKYNNITIYMSNRLNIKRVYKDTNELSDLKKYQLVLHKDNDIIIQGLGFIKVTDESLVTLYVRDGIKIYIRKNLI